LSGELPFSGRPLRLNISKKAFQSNIQIASELAPESQLIVVIKANAYGHGLIELAKCVGGHDVAVAVPEELACLLDHGVGNRVWVLEGPFSHDCLRLSAKADVVWVIHSLWQLDLIEQFGASLKLNVCLKLDTGMHRLGLSSEDLSVALEKVQASKHLELIACMSHFSESDQSPSISVSHQLKSFDQLVSDHNMGSLPQSLANSGAILFHSTAHRDFVRPGIMLYGGMPNSSQCAKDHNLKPVMTLESAVISLCRVPKGGSVGYGSRWAAQRDSLVATVAGGYADGYPRHAPNGTPVAVILGGEGGCVYDAPLIGRVSMDMLNIDVTDIPAVQVADRVELWGEKVPIDQVARLSDTISYELMTSVTSRVPRFYY